MHLFKFSIYKNNAGILDRNYLPGQVNRGPGVLTALLILSNQMLVQVRSRSHAAAGICSELGPDNIHWS